MAHIRKEPGFPAYQTDEHGNPISPEDCANPASRMAPSTDGLGGQEGQQGHTLFDMLQRSSKNYGQEGGTEKGELKKKIKKKLEGGSRDEPPLTTAQDEKKIDPQLLSRGSQLKATAGSRSYAKGGPK